MEAEEGREFSRFPQTKPLSVSGAVCDGKKIHGPPPASAVGFFSPSRLEVALAESERTVLTSQFGQFETETFGVKSSLNDIISEAVLKSSLIPFQSSDAMTFKEHNSSNVKIKPGLTLNL